MPRGLSNPNRMDQPGAMPRGLSNPNRMDQPRGAAPGLSRVGLPPGRCPGVHQHADLVGDSDECARLMARQGVLGADLAALEAIEHLLQGYLDALVLGAVAPGHENSGDPERRSPDEHEP